MKAQRRKPLPEVHSKQGLCWWHFPPPPPKNVGFVSEFHQQHSGMGPSGLHAVYP